MLRIPILAARWGVLLMLALLAGGCASQPPLERREFTRLCMGVQCRITLYASDESNAEAAAAEAFREVSRLEQIMSDYRPSSEVSKLCARAGEGPVQVSQELFEVLEVSRRVSKASGGAFDVTVGPLVALWREARQTGQMPDTAALARAKHLVGWELIELDGETRCVTLGRPGMKLDLGGIGKGYAAARAVGVLRSRGMPRCLVALAGDIAAGDAPPGAKGWRIGVVGGGEMHLANASVSTSGDSEQFVEIGGVRYSHIVDPRTGLGVVGGPSAVTVWGRDGALVDAVASAVCVTGDDGWVEREFGDDVAVKRTK
jgi:thiamine biosynthesis lipoprotein